MLILLWKLFARLVYFVVFIIALVLLFKVVSYKKFEDTAREIWLDNGFDEH